MMDDIKVKLISILSCFRHNKNFVSKEFSRIMNLANNDIPFSEGKGYTELTILRVGVGG
jgi:hypothetical protein